MIDQFMSRTFAARNIAHREHLKTDSYARHEALGAFYTDIIDAVDEVAEAYQGFVGLIGDYTVKDQEIDDITGYLRDEADWIEANRDIIGGGSSAVANLVDGATAIYLRTAYKLEQLK